MWKPRGISLSSGGMRVLGHFGVLARLREEGLLDDVVNWYGCSGGAMCAFFGILGCSPEWLRDGVRYFQGAAILQISDDPLTDVTSTLGIMSGEAYRDMIGRFADTWEPGSSQWTFADLERERPGRHLHVTALNITRESYDVFNDVTTPTVRVLDAIQASASIPLVFRPWRSAITGEIYCDGGIIEPFPWRHVADRDTTLVIACSDAVIRGRPEGRPIHSIGDYAAQIFAAVRRSIMATVADKPRHWIAVNNSTVGILDFKISEEERMRFFEEGVGAGSAWVAFMRDSSSRRSGTPPDHAPQNTSDADRSTLEQMSDTPLPCTPRPSAYWNPHPRTSGPQSSRRWSL